MCRKFSASLILAALLLAGCTVTPPVVETVRNEPVPVEGPTLLVLPEPMPDGQRAVLEAVALGGRVAALGVEEQRRAVTAAQQAVRKDRSEAARLKLAVLLALPSKGTEDDARAVTLLEGLAANGAEPVKQLAALLLAQVNERIHERRRVEQLRQQLDQLKAIERSLIERGSGK